MRNPIENETNPVAFTEDEARLIVDTIRSKIDEKSEAIERETKRAATALSEGRVTVAAKIEDGLVELEQQRSKFDQVYARGVLQLGAIYQRRVDEARAGSDYQIK